MVDIEMKKFRDRDGEMKEILSRLSKGDPAKEANVDGEMVDFLKQAIAKKEENLLCPVCLETAQIPIFTCPDSHIICSACVPKLKVQKCPQCRVDLPTPLKRHRFAEMTAAELEELVQKMRKVTAIDPHADFDIQKPHQDSSVRDVPAEPPTHQPRSWASVARQNRPGKLNHPRPPPDGKPKGFSQGGDSDFQQLYVGNLPLDCTEDQLSELFGMFGKVTNVWINEVTREDRAEAISNFGFIEFEWMDSVERALMASPIMLYPTHRLIVERMERQGLARCKSRD